jgi:hypothetical protein
MKTFFSRNLLLLIVSFVATLAVQSTAAAPLALPNPVLTFIGQEHFQAGGKQFIRYSYDVFNKDEYPAELFVASPALPPCGKNAKASRTWVDIYDQNGKRLNGFCALGKPGDLSRIWFALGEDELPPSWVYIELNDRKTNTKYKSNLAETTL